MSYKISSEKIANIRLVGLLRKLTEIFKRMKYEFYVIGATARDIITQQLVGATSERKTRDLDIAIAIPNWAAFDEIKTTLIANGFTKSSNMYQRFYFDGYELDVVPYGVAKDDDKIYWPPEEKVAMSVKGFDEVLSDAIIVDIDGEFNIKIASLYGLFILKYNAWLDRNQETSKDAEDMSFILSNYFIANVDRNVHQEVYNWTDFHEYSVGAYWLAHDLLSLLNKDQVAYYCESIEQELEKEDESRLINQILDNTYGLNYEIVVKAWRCMVDVFHEYI